MKRKKFMRSMKDAVQGLLFVIRRERNMRFHLVAAVLVLAASLYFKIDRIELFFVLTAVFFVIIAEVFNTALEKAIDLFTTEYHPLAKIIKDIAAGAVLCSAVFAVIVAWLVFWDKLWTQIIM